MRPRVRLALAVLAIVGGLSLTLGARGSLAPAATAVQIELADILFAHGGLPRARWASTCGPRAPTDRRPAEPGPRRASSARRLRIGEFAIASTHSAALRSAQPSNAEALTLSGDAFWASGLFDEAEAAYRDALAVTPSLWRARNGLAKSLASRGGCDEALVEAQAGLRIGRRPRARAAAHARADQRGAPPVQRRGRRLPAVPRRPSRARPPRPRALDAVPRQLPAVVPRPHAVRARVGRRRGPQDPVQGRSRQGGREGKAERQVDGLRRGHGRGEDGASPSRLPGGSASCPWRRR